MTTFEPVLRKDEHTRQFEIRVEPGGWRVLDRADATVLRDAHYSDWHRVERARRAFSVEMSTLRAEGWLDAR